MVYKYIRFSSDKQDEQSQNQIIYSYCRGRGLQCDETIRDEAISGKEGSYTKRDLLRLFNQLEVGDTLICSELSRITRGGVLELGNMVAEWLKPRKIRLIICGYNLDINCASMDATTELQLAMLATFAKMERDNLIQRTKAALEVRKRMVETDGGWFSKSGKWCTSLGGEKGRDMSSAAAASALASKNAKMEWFLKSEAFQHVRQMVLDGKSNSEILNDMEYKYYRNPELWCTRGGACLSKGTLSKWRKMIENGMGNVKQ